MIGLGNVAVLHGNLVWRPSYIPPRVAVCDSKTRNYFGRSVQQHPRNTPAEVNANDAADSADQKRCHHSVVLSKGPAGPSAGRHADEDAEFHGSKGSMIET